MTLHKERARKRAEIGLAPVRPTAQATFQRPPGESAGRGTLWLPVGLVAAVLLATLLLLGARLSGVAVRWPDVQLTATDWWANFTNRRSLVEQTATPALTDTTERLVAADDFTQAQGLLAANQQDGQWDLAYQPADGVYQMQLSPNRLAWSTLGAAVLRNFRLDLVVTIADLRPDGYAGLLGRYQNHENFYLFAVDGRGRYQVQLWQAGQLQTLLPWMESGRIHLAGEANRLTLADDGATLRLSINGQLLFEVQAPALPLGDAGVFGAAPPQTSAEMAVTELRLYELAAGE